MSDPFKHLTPGEMIRISARGYNAALDAGAEYQRTRGMGSGAGAVSGPGSVPNLQIYVQHEDDEETLPFATVWTPTTPLVNPDAHEMEARRKPGVWVNAPATSDDPIVIITEPALAGELGRAVVSGVALVHVNVSDSSHRYARPIPGDSTALESAPSGPACLLGEAEEITAGSGLRYVLLGAPPTEYASKYLTARATTTDKLPLAYHTNGPYPAYTPYLVAAANGALPAQDGVTLVKGDTLLVRFGWMGDLGEQRYNSVYILTDAGSPSTPWRLDLSGDVAIDHTGGSGTAWSRVAGAVVAVTEGTTQNGTTWQCQLRPNGTRVAARAWEPLGPGFAIGTFTTDTGGSTYGGYSLHGERCATMTALRPEGIYFQASSSSGVNQPSGGYVMIGGMSATLTQKGMVTTANQQFSGLKTFVNGVSVPPSTTGHGVWSGAVYIDGGYDIAYHTVNSVPNIPLAPSDFNTTYPGFMGGQVSGLNVGSGPNVAAGGGWKLHAQPYPAPFGTQPNVHYGEDLLVYNRIAFNDDGQYDGLPGEHVWYSGRFIVMGRYSTWKGDEQYPWRQDGGKIYTGIDTDIGGVIVKNGIVVGGAYSPPVPPPPDYPTDGLPGGTYS